MITAIETASTGALTGYKQTAFKPYVYKGTGEDTLTPDTPQGGGKPKRIIRRPPCGTNNGYSFHRRHDETPCDECREAARLKATEIRRRRGAKPRQLKPCGTVAAWARHKNNNEEPCQDCKDAFRAHHTEKRRAAGMKPRKYKPCGTNAAWARHKRRGEPIDDACREAHNKTTAAYMKKSRQLPKPDRAADRRAADQVKNREAVDKTRAAA